MGDCAGAVRCSKGLAGAQEIARTGRDRGIYVSHFTVCRIERWRTFSAGEQKDAGRGEGPERGEGADQTRTGSGRSADTDAAGAGTGTEGRSAAAEMVRCDEPVDAARDWKVGGRGEGGGDKEEASGKDGGTAAAGDGGRAGTSASAPGGFSEGTEGADGVE